ncbi:response regulator [Halomonas sp. M20]|uniref:response regulator n=1 Tax=Halomonas sp. M20 TaxID=2763264 RepID=UPI001D0AAC45|nr:response regulator [Halomonas sp. M20]
MANNIENTAAPFAQSPPEQDLAAPITATFQRVLHVEDDESIIAITRVALETLGGLSVLSCSYGEQAIEQAPAYAPDLLLLDVMMPDMDGPTTLIELSKVLDVSRRPVVFMTAKTEEADHQRYFDLNASAVIVKPFDPVGLAARLGTIWEDFQKQENNP